MRAVGLANQHHQLPVSAIVQPGHASAFLLRCISRLWQKQHVAMAVH